MEQTSGHLRLDSGDWDWTTHRTAGGWSIQFDHRDRSADSMRSWSDAIALTAKDIAEAGRRPFERHLRGFDGEIWSLSLEIPRNGNRSGYDLTFRRGPRVITKSVGEDYALGDQPSFDLMHYLKDQLMHRR